MSVITTVWLVAAFVLATVELFTGSFYLLVLSSAAFTGAGLTHFCGLSLVESAIAASAVAVIGVLYVHTRLRMSKKAPSEQSLDIGNKVYVESFKADKTGTAVYRGATWQVVYAGPHEVPSSGTFVITAVKGLTLIVS